MWDAKEQYWKGHEWWSGNKDQPVLNDIGNGNYAQSNTDPRWYHEGGGSGRFDATQSCASLPNANEMSWYAVKGDPRWDADELWTTMGHLYNGGMWFKKKSVLQAENHYDTEKSADGTTDLRTTYKYYSNSNSSINNSGLPSAADANNYFYLPTLGYYDSGQLNYVGYGGSYWSSSAIPWTSVGAYGLFFYRDGSVIVSFSNRYRGYRVEPTFK